MTQGHRLVSPTPDLSRLPYLLYSKHFICIIQSPHQLNKAGVQPHFARNELSKKGYMTCPRSHSESVAEPRLKPRRPSFRTRPMMSSTFRCRNSDPEKPYRSCRLRPEPVVVSQGNGQCTEQPSGRPWVKPEDPEPLAAASWEVQRRSDKEPE